MLDKQRVLEAFREVVASQLAALAQVTAATREEATGEESVAEGKYDTRATEAAYLAAGQGARLAELKRLASWLAAVVPHAHAAVQVGSLVALDRAGTPRRWVWVGPVGGPRVTVDGEDVQLISLSSPMGEQIEDAEVGDEAELEMAGRWVTLTVAHVV